MKKYAWKRLSAVAMSLCFLVSAVGTAHACKMQSVGSAPAGQVADATSGMDCHASEKSGKAGIPQCCIDMSCTQCFGPPVTVEHLQALPGMTAAATLPPATAYPLVSRVPDAPERPPKMV